MACLALQVIVLVVDNEGTATGDIMMTCHIKQAWYLDPSLHKAFFIPEKRGKPLLGTTQNRIDMVKAIIDIDLKPFTPVGDNRKIGWIILISDRICVVNVFKRLQFHFQVVLNDCINSFLIEQGLNHILSSKNPVWFYKYKTGTPFTCL